MKKILCSILLLSVLFCVGCSEKSSSTTTVESGTTGVQGTTWRCIYGSNTLTFIFSTGKTFEFSDVNNAEKVNDIPVANVAKGTYAYKDSELTLTFKEATGTLPPNQTCTVKNNQFTYSGYTFVKL